MSAQKPATMFEAMLKGYTTEHLRKTLEILKAASDTEMSRDVRAEIEFRERIA